MAPIPTKFSGVKLRKARENANLSRFKLCRAMNFAIGQDTLRKYEAGLHVPTLDTAILLAQALKIPLKKLTNAKG